MNERQRQLAEKAAALARGPVWHQRPHDHLQPARWPLPHNERCIVHTS